MQKKKKEIALQVFHQTKSVSKTIWILGYTTRSHLHQWVYIRDVIPQKRKALPKRGHSPNHPRNPS